MNRAYRHIWSAAKEAWIVAAEIVQSRGRCPAGAVKPGGVTVDIYERE